jgi:hypothetical protein
MRPRINKFGKVFYQEINDYLTNNYVYGFTVKRNVSTLIYTFLIMFRENKKDPEELYIEVSNNSKLVIGASTNRGKTFMNIDELKQYTKKLS